MVLEMAAVPIDSAAVQNIRLLIIRNVSGAFQRRCRVRHEACFESSVFVLRVARLQSDFSESDAKCDAPSHFKWVAAGIAGPIHRCRITHQFCDLRSIQGSRASVG